MKIGLFGGTFDPIHLGHLIVAEQAREAADLDEVWFIPAASPPHKVGSKITEANHRANMVEQAVADHPSFRLSRIELTRSGPSYTVDTVRYLRQSHPEHDFFLIVGGDMVKDLPSWYKIEEILQNVGVVGCVRPGTSLAELPPLISQHLVAVAEQVQIHLSSTWIREQIIKGNSIRYLVPEAVRKYIEEYKLYGC